MTRKDCLASPIDIENDDDDDEDDDDDGKSDDSDVLRKRKKSKKSKKKKSKKKKKKKRNKSISSIENISDNDSVLDDDIINLTPPLRPSTPTKWEKRYTPLHSLSKSPITPPLRPNSNMSIYSETSRRTPPLSQKYNASSPHTPPLVPRKSAASYHGDENSDKLQPNADGDVRKSVVYVVDKYYSNYNTESSDSHYHHHSYHHSSATAKESISSSSRRSKSPSKHFHFTLFSSISFVVVKQLLCIRSFHVFSFSETI